MRALLATLLVCLVVGLAQGAVGDVWDCAAQFDFNNNPSANGIWAYKLYTNTSLLSIKRNGNMYWGVYGWSLTSGAWDPSALFSWYPAYPQNGIYLEQSTDFGGHGPWLVEWTSPVDGWVKVSGCMYVSGWGSGNKRVIHWSLSHNNQVFTQGYVHYDPVTYVTPVGRANAVYFDTDGSCGTTAVYRKVRAGDTIGLISEGSTINPGDPYGTFVGATFKIQQVDEPDFAAAGAELKGDLTLDCHVAFDDFAKFAINWLAQSCQSPSYCNGADLDYSGSVDAGDVAIFAANWCQSTARYRNLGYVIVSPMGPNDGGDFGPFTPQTNTSGIQEAFDFAHANGRDVYIADGTSSSTQQSQYAVYYLNETLHVPWGWNWHLDGGQYRMVYTPTSGDAIVIDSQQNCLLKFGAIDGGNSSGQTIVRVRPTTPGPNSSIVCAANTFTFAGIAGTGGVDAGNPDYSMGVGIVLDGSQAPGGIQNNKFVLGHVSSCETGLYLAEKVSGNVFTAAGLDTLGTAVQAGDADTGSGIAANIFNVLITSSNTGLRMFGSKNLVTINSSGNLSGQGIVFEEGASENLVTNSYLPQGFTNNATSTANRIIPANAMNYGVTTPPVPSSGIDIANNNPCLVDVQIVTAGQVSSWTVTDSASLSQTFTGTLNIGQRFCLPPGFKVRFTYTQAPTWRWMGRN